MRKQLLEKEKTPSYQNFVKEGLKICLIVGDEIVEPLHVGFLGSR